MGVECVRYWWLQNAVNKGTEVGKYGGVMMRPCMSVLRAHVVSVANM